MNEALIQWPMAPEAPEGTLTLEDFLHRPEWHQRGACRGAGTDAFIRGPKADYGSTRELCEGCRVRQECPEAALDDPDLVGLWEGPPSSSSARSAGSEWHDDCIPKTPSAHRLALGVRDAVGGMVTDSVVPHRSSCTIVTPSATTK